ncbi:MAG TPA: TetR/AcrR family transcriptional regulator [Bryobacteraceae bacterium]|nr:TetR/AcrR family transcriptional regulator [Bryobacteraceae bacterium]
MLKESETVDPRIRRTRLLLQQALQKLLQRKEFDAVSVQDIAEAATVNRATFYDHYNDKFALLECMVGSEFQELLVQREVQFDATCGSALKAIFLAVCDYLARMQTPQCRRALQPHMEAAIIAVVRRTFLDGLKQHPPTGGVAPEIVAAAVSWALYGSAKEWVQTESHGPADAMADTVAALVAPMLHFNAESTSPPSR